MSKHPCKLSLEVPGFQYLLLQNQNLQVGHPAVVFPLLPHVYFKPQNKIFKCVCTHAQYIFNFGFHVFGFMCCGYTLFTWCVFIKAGCFIIVQLSLCSLLVKGMRKQSNLPDTLDLWHLWKRYRVLEKDTSPIFVSSSSNVIGYFNLFVCEYCAVCNHFKRSIQFYIYTLYKSTIYNLYLKW